MNPLLYFDHNATTPVAPEVADAFAAALREVHGNASSTHRAGQLAKQRLEHARRTIAQRLRCSAADLVFTSGGTEANNLAVLGLARSLQMPAKHVVASTIEHPAVLEPVRQLEREGVAVTFVSPDQIEDAIRPETVLVTLMHANNETGAIHDIERIASTVTARRFAGQAIFFHSDGVQALGKIPVDLGRLGPDLYSVSAHKIYGPKGVGALFVRKDTPHAGIQLGGRHERGRRAGTENVPGAIAFARAVELIDQNNHAGILRDCFESQVLSALDRVGINAGDSPRLPNTSNLRFCGVSGEALLIALDTAGFAVSTGSACSSGSIEPSPVLLAMGLTAPEARSSVRFSFGRTNTTEDTDRLAEAVIAQVRRMRASKRERPQLVHA